MVVQSMPTNWRNDIGPSGGGGCEIYLGHYRGTSWIQEITPICYANIAQLKPLELWINIFFGSHTSLNDCFGITGLSSLCTYIYCKSKQTYTMCNLLRQSLDAYVDNQKGFQALSWQNLHGYVFFGLFCHTAMITTNIVIIVG